MKTLGITPLLNVRDVDRSCAFYAGVFGLTIVEQAGPTGELIWARLEGDGTVLMVNRHGEGSERRLRERTDHGDIVLYINVQGAAELHGRLVGLGFDPGAIERQHYGVLQFSLYDPDGYELAITERIA